MFIWKASCSLQTWLRSIRNKRIAARAPVPLSAEPTGATTLLPNENVAARLKSDNKQPVTTIESNECYKTDNSSDTDTATGRAVSEPSDFNAATAKSVQKVDFSEPSESFHFKMPSNEITCALSTPNIFLSTSIPIAETLPSSKLSEGSWLANQSASSKIAPTSETDAKIDGPAFSFDSFKSTGVDGSKENPFDFKKLTKIETSTALNNVDDIQTSTASDMFKFGDSVATSFNTAFSFGAAKATTTPSVDATPNSLHSSASLSFATTSSTSATSEPKFSFANSAEKSKTGNFDY